jgi:hypothetical protein
MTYKFENWNIEIIDPIKQVVNVIDNIENKTCNVDLLLTTDTAQFGVTLNGFTYSETWTDQDVRDWVTIELEKYEVNG